MGNTTGKLWRNPEDDLLRDRYSPDFTPPPQNRPLMDNSPLFRPPPQQDEEQAGRLRALKSDCVMDTAAFAKWPTVLGIGYGAAMAAVHARPDLKESANLKGPQSGLVLATKGFVRELKYLRTPVLVLGGGAALYSMVSCAAAKWRDYDGVANSALAGGTLGIVAGIYMRNPNVCFMGATWLSLFAALSKMAWLDPRAYRPKATFYELAEYRRRALRPEIQEQAPDGYVHRWLQEGLKDQGLAVPETWSRFQPSSAAEKH